MKASLSISILLFFAFISFGQTSKTQEVNLSFKTPNNIQIERDNDSTGYSLHSIEIEVKAIGKKQITKDVLIEAQLEHITTSNGSIQLINSIIPVKKDDLFQSRTQYCTIKFQVFHTTSMTEEVAKLKLSCPGVTFSEADHQRYIQLKTAQSDTTSEKSEASESASNAKTNLTAKDTVAAAKLRLSEAVKNGIYQDKHNNLTFEIDCVHVYFEKGRIQRVQVFPKNDDGVFQSKYPISATYFNQLRESRFYYEGSNPSFDQKYVELGKVINYTELMARSQFPPDGHVVLKPIEKTSQVIEFYRNPISYFDARIYTDPTSITGNSNGLLLTELNSSFILNTRNFGHFTFVPYINMNLNWAKFDSKFDTLAFSNLNTRNRNDILTLRQQANINFLIDLELLRYSGKHESILGFGHHLATTNISDTTGKALKSIHPSFFVYWHGELFANPWLKLDCTLPIYAQYNHDQVFTEYGRKWDMIIAPQLELTILPAQFKTTSKTNDQPDGAKLFARVRYFDMPNAKGNNFVQFQTGVSFSISDLFDKK